MLTFSFLPDVDKYESNEWDNGEEYQVKDAGNLMTFARNVRAFIRLATIHQVTGGSEEVNLIMMRVDESWHSTFLTRADADPVAQTRRQTPISFVLLTML